jgi:hypothetical protein
MSPQQIEQRLARLESRVDELQAELAASKRPGKDWRRTAGAFTDDPGMQEILEGAMQLREEDRKRARMKKPAKRKRREDL